VQCSGVEYLLSLFALQYWISSATNHNHYHLLLLSQDDKFDYQPAHGLLPKLLLTPFEQLLLMCTKGLSDANKDIMVGLLADAYCERVEHYISQVRQLSYLMSYHLNLSYIISSLLVSYGVIFYILFWLYTIFSYVIISHLMSLLLFWSDFRVLWCTHRSTPLFAVLTIHICANLFILFLLYI
jgi:hypothetical protein